MWPRRKRQSEATQARIRAEKKTERTEAETPKYQALAERLRKHYEENHFEALFRHDVKGDRS